MKPRVPVIRLLIALPLGGCTEHINAVEAFAIGLVGLGALFVLLLFVLPPVLDDVERRNWRERMRNRKPWSPETPKPRRRRRRRKGA